MLESNRQILVDIKGSLLQVLEEHLYKYEECDTEQMEYLIQLIDYMLMDKMPMCKLTIEAFMEEIITTSIYSLTPEVLTTLHKVKQLQEEINGEVHIWEE